MHTFGRVLALVCLLLWLFLPSAHAVEFTVMGTQGAGSALNTGVTFGLGDILVVTATGSVNWTTPGGSLHDPDGMPDCFTAGGSSWLPGECRMALVGQLGSAVFLLGSSFRGPAPAPGTLLLGVNDDLYGDNQGSFSVTVERIPVGRPHKLVFYGDATGAAGHAFVQFVPGSGPQAGQELFFGLHPEQADLFVLFGKVKNDRNNPWTWRITYYVSDIEYLLALNKVNQDSADTSLIYNLGARNCVNWIAEVAEAAGVTLPDHEFLLVDNPETFIESLMAIGDCGMFAGGLVTESPEERAFTGSPCVDWNAKGVMTASLVDPAGLAGDIGLTASDVDLGTVSLQPSGELRIDLSNLDPLNALVTVDWGDGSPLEGQTTSLSHTYPDPGVYPASVAIVDRGHVRRWRVDAEIAPGGDPVTTIDIMVPAPMPSTVIYPGCEDPEVLLSPCPAGNVQGCSGAAMDVLFVNGSSGGDARMVNVPVGVDLTVALDSMDPNCPVAGTYVLWAWQGLPQTPVELIDADTQTPIGCLVNPTPFHQLSPQPFRCLRGQGTPRAVCRGVRELNAPPLAPWSVTRAGGLSIPITMTLQGVVRDPRAANTAGFSITNAVTIVVE